MTQLGAAVACGEPPGGHSLLDGRGQPQQADRVGDRRPRTAQAERDGVMGETEGVGQARIRGRFLDRVEVLAVEVLGQRELQ